MKKFLPILLICLTFLSACDQSGTKECPADNSVKASQEKSGNAVTVLFKPERSGKVVARVYGVPIYEDELNGRPVESLITDEIFYQEGLKEGIDKKFQDKIREYQMRLVVWEVKGKIAENMPPEKEITDKDVLDYYNSTKDNIYTNIRVQEIQFTDKNLGEQILKSAEEGKDLQGIASSLSNPESQVTVKDLGFNKRLNTYFDVKKAGALSKVIEEQDGTYSILKILEVREIPFANVKNVINSNLKSRRKASAFNHYARKLAKEKGISIEIVNKTTRN